jgi:predicted DNA-binding transcriptional regulator AlpA
MPIQKRAPRAGTAVVWPKGVEERYGISAPTRWRWEKIGRLPARDVNLQGKTGWRPGTLDAAEGGTSSSAA